MPEQIEKYEAELREKQETFFLSLAHVLSYVVLHPEDWRMIQPHLDPNIWADDFAAKDYDRIYQYYSDGNKDAYYLSSLIRDPLLAGLLKDVLSEPNTILPSLEIAIEIADNLSKLKNDCAAIQTIVLAQKENLPSSKLIEKIQALNIERPIKSTLGVPARVSEVIDDFPPRQWIVENWMIRGAVTSLYGDGGLGKSMLAQQLACCIAGNRPFLDMPTMPGNVVCLFAEDDLEEIERRQQSIYQRLKMPPLASEAMKCFSGQGKNNILMEFKKESGALTPLFHELYSVCTKSAPSLIVIDTAADVMAGDENDRSTVNQFLKGCLGKLAKDFNAAVLLCAHPSKSALQSGLGYSGSTSWYNGVRALWSLTSASTSSSEEQAESLASFRYLELKKSNYSKAGEKFEIQIDSGAFIRAQKGYADTVARTAANNFENEILNCLGQLINEKICPAKSVQSGKYYAPRLIAERLGEDVQKIDRVVGKLIAHGKIVEEVVVNKGRNLRDIICPHDHPIRTIKNINKMGN